MSKPHRFSLEELEALPTLATGQTSDLKYESRAYRVWLSRCGVEDGEPYPNKVTVEHCALDRGGIWHQIEEYRAFSTVDPSIIPGPTEYRSHRRR